MRLHFIRNFCICEWLLLEADAEAEEQRAWAKQVTAAAAELQSAPAPHLFAAARLVSSAAHITINWYWSVRHVLNSSVVVRA